MNWLWPQITGWSTYTFIFVNRLEIIFRCIVCQWSFFLVSASVNSTVITKLPVKIDRNDFNVVTFHNYRRKLSVSALFPLGPASTYHFNISETDGFHESWFPNRSKFPYPNVQSSKWPFSLMVKLLQNIPHCILF